MATQLTGNQAERLRDALFAAFPNEFVFDAEVLQPLNESLTKIAPANLAYPNRLGVVIQDADSRDWLLALLAQARKRRPSDTVLPQIENEFKPLAPPAGVDPFDVCCLTGSHVMIDRTDLRSALRVLVKAQGKRILIVRGEARSGKSHSLQLISYLQQVRQGFSIAWIDLEKIAQSLAGSTLIQPSHVARSLVRLTRYKDKVGIPDPPSDAQWAAWVLDFCEDYEAVASADAHPWWVVIDGFNQVLLPQPTLDLIKELANRISVTLPTFRLVLLGFTESLAPNALGHVTTEAIPKITIEHITNFFAQAYQELQFPPSADLVAEAIERVLAKVDMAQSQFLEQLGPAASQELGR